MAEKNNKLISGVFILTMSNILVKAIGLILKIPLTNIIGDEGMGYFNAAYSIYVWFYMLSTAGLPVAVSILISECRAKGRVRETKTVFRVTLGMFVLIGLTGMTVMIAASKPLARLIGTEPAYLCIIAIAPTLFFVCISSAIRGYFQGCQNMIPTAISQIIEATGKLTIGILLAVYSVKKGFDLPTTAAYTILGLVVGVAASMIFLVATKLLHSIREGMQTEKCELYEPRSKHNIAATLIKIAIPITISASVMSLTNLVDSIMVIRRLKDIGFVENVAVAMYGNYTSLAVPMFNLPPALIYPISYAIVPLISSALAASAVEKTKEIIRRSIKVTSIIIIPCALGMTVLAEPILKIFFKPESAETAAPLLSLLAVSSFFVALLSITNAVLQATGNERIPIVSMAIGAAVKLISSYFLIGAIGMYGTPISTFICYLVITAINFYFVAKKTGVTPMVGYMFMRPLVSGLLCAITAIVTYSLLDGFIGLRVAALVSICAAVLVYIVAILLMGGVDAEDIRMIPGGKRLYPVLKQLKLMK